ncbi:MAG: hypothetical protein AAFQ90_00565 [Pseudomonadota bacterium]
MILPAPQSILPPNHSSSAPHGLAGPGQGVLRGGTGAVFGKVASGNSADAAQGLVTNSGRFAEHLAASKTPVQAAAAAHGLTSPSQSTPLPEV